MLNTDERIAIINSLDDWDKGGILAWISGFAPEVFNEAIASHIDQKGRTARYLANQDRLPQIF